jgi:two-component system, OmpR family, alkaline phosphatase synthesis response regulator PhoP
VTAPTEIVEPVVPDAVSERPSQAVPANGPDRAIVVATDREMRAALMADLSAVGYEATDAPSGATVDDLGPASIVVVAAEGDAPERRLAQSLRRSPSFAGTPIVWVARADGGELGRSEALFDDFLELPYTRAGLAARLSVARRRFGHAGGDVLRRGTLVLNLSTFQATLGGEPVELTYMEYQLLRFLAATPARVHTRQAILHHVWGYDYYGGVRTVDVHVRRLRVKLGEHAAMIETVRSVGYRFAGGA